MVTKRKKVASVILSVILLLNCIAYIAQMWTCVTDVVACVSVCVYWAHR